MKELEKRLKEIQARGSEYISIVEVQLIIAQIKREAKNKRLKLG